MHTALCHKTKQLPLCVSYRASKVPRLLSGSQLEPRNVPPISKKRNPGHQIIPDKFEARTRLI